jgi:serine phosphatase RsbU (regulator of sigma subunit)
MAAIRLTDAGPAAIMSSVTNAIDTFAAGAPQEDDITLLAIKRPGGRA